MNRDDNNTHADQVRQQIVRVALRSKGEPLVISDESGVTTISRFIAVLDEIWDNGTDDWASYEPPEETQGGQPPDEEQGDAPPAWLESPSSRFVAVLMNERTIASEEASAIATTVDDAHALLAGGDLDAVDHLLNLIGEAASAIVNMLNKPPPGDI